MGWNSGGEILEEVALVLHREFGNTEPGKQCTILSVLINSLEEQDCDVLDECFGLTPACDAALELAGYHKPTSKCEWNSDFTRCFCGWQEE